MTEPKRDGDKGDFSLARKMLGNVGKSKPATTPGSSGTGGTPKQTPGSGGGDVLGQLVNALRTSSGGTGGGAVEPEGYGYFEPARAGIPLGRDARYEAIEALQRVLARIAPPMKVTGRWDVETDGALLKIQKENGCEDEVGTVGPKTVLAFDKLLGLNKKSAGGDEGGDLIPRGGQASRVMPATGNKFIDSLTHGAVKGMRDYGVPASVSIAMAVLESSWGQAPLARDHFNVFSIKGKGPAGSVTMREEGGNLSPGGTTAYRKYNDASEAVHEHARLFASSDQYAGVMTHKARPEDFARALTGVYSTMPNYGTTLIRIMQQFELSRFDRMAQAF
jgi:hypothetical protein